MSKKDIIHQLDVSEGLAAQVIKADKDSGQIDMQGYDAAVFIVNVGTSGDTLSGTLKIDLKLEESDTSGSGFTSVGANDLLYNSNANQFPATIDADGEDAKIYYACYVGSKRYVKALWDVTGTHSNGTPGAIQVIKQKLNTPV